MRRFATGLSLIVGFIICPAVCAQNLYYPPQVKEEIDFEGRRFNVKDTENQLFGKRLPGSLMKKDVMIFLSRPAHGSARPRDMYLVKIKPLKKKRHVDTDDDDIENDDDKDTFIRQVKTLNDLRGFVRIRTETDALEFLRFGSSMLTGFYFAERMNEVFCVRSEDSRGIESDVMWGTIDECRQFGFLPPQVLNPVDPRGRGRKEDVDDDDGARGHFFLITRTVYSLKNRAEFLRVTEEVGPVGQWRIVGVQSLGSRTPENTIFFGKYARPERPAGPLTAEELEEEKRKLGITK